MTSIQIEHFKNFCAIGFKIGNSSTADMVTSKKKTMSNDQNLSQFKVFPSANSNSSTSTSSTYYDASVTHRTSLPYLLFTVVVNLNALSLLPPKLDGQKRRHEIKSKPSAKHIKYHKNVLKKEIKTS